MIITFILNVLYQTISLILAPLLALPTATLPTGLTSSIATINAYFALLHSMLPVFTVSLLIGIALVITIENYKLVYKFIMWLVRKIPTIS
jgi:hypothetical protein